jgi:hypothetical protein
MEDVKGKITSGALIAIGVAFGNENHHLYKT